MTFINIVYLDGREYSYIIPRIDPAKIEQLKAAPGVREVRVRGNVK